MNPSRAIASRSTSALQRALFSLVAFLVAGVFGGILLMLGPWDFVFFGPEHIDNVAANTLITFLVAAPIWLFAMLPLSLASRGTSSICGASMAPAFGAVCGAVAVLLELVLVFSEEPMYREPKFYVVGAAIGACAWSAFAWMLRGSEVAATHDTR